MSIRNDEVFQATAEYIPSSSTLECMPPEYSYTPLLISYHSDTIFRTFDEGFDNVRVVGGGDRLKVGKYIELKTIIK